MLSFPVLNRLCDERVIADATSHSVIILSPERNTVRLRKLLTELDQPVKQVLVRV